MYDLFYCLWVNLYIPVFPLLSFRIDDLDWLNSFRVKAEGVNNTKLPKDKGKYIGINTSRKYKDLSHTKRAAFDNKNL